jgi:hypothetical protein
MRSVRVVEGASAKTRPLDDEARRSRAVAKAEQEQAVKAQREAERKRREAEAENVRLYQDHLREKAREAIHELASRLEYKETDVNLSYHPEVVTREWEGSEEFGHSVEKRIPEYIAGAFRCEKLLFNAGYSDSILFVSLAGDHVSRVNIVDLATLGAALEERDAWNAGRPAREAEARYQAAAFDARRRTVKREARAGAARRALGAGCVVLVLAAVAFLMMSALMNGP